LKPENIAKQDCFTGIGTKVKGEKMKTGFEVKEQDFAKEGRMKPYIGK